MALKLSPSGYQKIASGYQYINPTTGQKLATGGTGPVARTSSPLQFATPAQPAMGRRQPSMPSGLAGLTKASAAMPAASAPMMMGGRQLSESGKAKILAKQQGSPAPQQEAPYVAPESGSGTSAAGGSFGNTGSTAPGTGNLGLGALGGFSLGSVGPVGLSLSPLGTLGLGFTGGTRGENSAVNSFGKTLGGFFGIPTSINPLSFISSIAPALGPAGLGLGAFTGLVGLSTMAAHAMGVPTVQEGLVSLQASLNSTSEAAQSVGQHSLSTAQGLSNGTVSMGQVGAMNLSPTAVAQINGALSAMGHQGFANSASPLGYSYAGIDMAQNNGPQGFGYGLDFSNPSVAQGFAANAAHNAAQAAAAQAAQQTVAPTTLTTSENTIDLEPNDPTSTAANSDPNADTSEGTAGSAASGGQSGQSEGAAAASAAAAAAAADAGPAGPGPSSSDASGGSGGDGGGGSGGDCLLMNWATKAQGTQDQNKQFFQELYDQFQRAYPDTARYRFARYQRVAKQIIDAADKQGPDVASQVQSYINDKVVAPLGAHLEANELDQALQRMGTTVRVLADHFGVPVPPDAQAGPGGA